MNDDVFVELQKRLPVSSSTKHEKYWYCCEGESKGGCSMSSKVEIERAVKQ